MNNMNLPKYNFVGYILSLYSVGKKGVNPNKKIKLSVFFGSVYFFVTLCFGWEGFGASVQLENTEIISNETAEILRKNLSQRPSDLETRKKLATFYVTKKNYKRAIQLLVDVGNNLDKAALLILRDAYGADGRTLDSIRALQNALLLDKQDMKLHIELADLYLSIKNMEDAIDQLRSAIGVNPKYEESYSKLLAIYLDKEKKTEAIELVKDMAKQFGAKPKYLNHLCHLNTDHGLLDDAVNYCLQAVAQDELLADNHVYLGLAYTYKGNEEQGSKIIEKAARQFPQSQLAAKSAGKLNEDKKNFVAAQKLFSTCVKYHPRSFECLIGLARSAFETGEFQTSLTAFVKSCVVNKSDTSTSFRAAAAKIKSQNLRKPSSDVDENLVDRFARESIKCRL